ncbi:MAG: uracil-DNA glycosylase [Candidatus Liberibacter ctenarytainae]|uniref:Uracil-DNA glycosylase n=1 Tax=Candidatus Liberibacter ctenarytainae TaxID=2020335 RepID=A0A937AKX8_9HYPH|nr:uracil-DNA glycosylase [Candidatus Liberibacter ctenarytainae]
MNPVHTLSQEQILTIALFYADAGIHCLFESPNKTINQSIKTHILHQKNVPIDATSKPIITLSKTDHLIVQQASSIARRARSLIELKSMLSSFHDCPLRNTALSTICADNEKADLMIIGYTPSSSDNTTGRALSGGAGNMLDKMLQSIGIARTDTCISTISPWHPPGNRKISALETEICRPIIRRQLELSSPKILFLLGNQTTQFFFNNNQTISQNYGKWNKIIINNCIIPTLSTVHPQELLEYPLIKKIAWHHLISLKKKLDSEF